MGRDRIAVADAVSANVPNHHRAAAVLPLWNRAFEAGVVQRVIFHVHGQAAIASLQRWSFGHCPGAQYPFHLQAEIIVQIARGVLLNHEQPLLLGVVRCGNFGRRLWCLGKIALCFVCGQGGTAWLSVIWLAWSHRISPASRHNLRGFSVSSAAAGRRDRRFSPTV